MSIRSSGESSIFPRYPEQQASAEYVLSVMKMPGTKKNESIRMYSLLFTIMIFLFIEHDIKEQGIFYRLFFSHLKQYQRYSSYSP